MRDKRDIVITAYGNDRTIDKLAVSIFVDDSEWRDEQKNAQTYCDMITSLELKKGSWVFAKIVCENTPFELETFFPFNFEAVILKLDNMAIQKIVREIDSKSLAVALIGSGDNVKKKIYANLTKGAIEMLEEDMELMKQANFEAVTKNRDKVLHIVRYLADTGEITIGENKEGNNEQ